jgi:hypothetical protein
MALRAACGPSSRRRVPTAPGTVNPQDRCAGSRGVARNRARGCRCRAGPHGGTRGAGLAPARGRACVMGDAGAGLAPARGRACVQLAALGRLPGPL